jgi:hypothetical protein
MAQKKIGPGLTFTPCMPCYECNHFQQLKTLNHFRLRRRIARVDRPQTSKRFSYRAMRISPEGTTSPDLRLTPGKIPERAETWAPAPTLT